MSHKVGTDLGGIRSVEGILERCVVDPDTNCWHWRLALQNGQARMSVYHPVTGKRMKTTGSKGAYMLSHRADVPSGHIAWLRCRSKDCCNPAHVRCTTKVEWGKFVAAQGRLKGKPHRIAANLKNGRMNAKLTAEDARAVRSSELSAAEEARRRNVSVTTITEIRRGKRWKEATRMSSVFTWAEAA